MLFDHFKTKFLPTTGTALVGGIVSATKRRKTVSDKRTVIPRLIFSPDSGGKKKLSSATIDTNVQGKIRLKT